MPDERFQIVSAERAYDRLAEVYDTAYSSSLARAENALAFRFVRLAGCDQGRVLDLGCGTGLFLEHMPIAPDLYIGVDISVGMLRVAQRKFPNHTFIQADMADLALLHDRSFDSIVSLFASFAYALEPERVVAEIARLLTTGGHFLIMTLSLRHRDRTPFTVEQENLSVPWRLWTPAELHHLFARFDHVRVCGTHSVADRWATTCATSAFGRLALEAATLGQVAPQLCRYLIITGANNDMHNRQV